MGCEGVPIMWRFHGEVAEEGAVGMMAKPVSLVLDFETTGLDKHKDRIIEIGMILTDWREIYAALHSYINPEYDFGHNAANGLSYTDVCAAPTFRLMAEGGFHYIAALADEYVAFQASFDLGFLKEELARIGLHLPRREVF